MVATRRGGNGTLPDGSQVEHTGHTSLTRTRQADYMEHPEDSNDDCDLTPVKMHRTRRNSSRTEDLLNAQDSNHVDEEKYSVNGPSYRQYDKHVSHRSSPQHHLSNEHDYKAPRHPQANADILPKKQRGSVSHSRSLRSLGLEEEGSSGEEEDGIGALASSVRHRTSSRDFPNMLLRRSSRNRKTIYSTLNVSTIEHAHAAMISDEIDHDEMPRRSTGSRMNRQRSIKPELRDLLVAQGKNPEDIAEISQPDIYSSIKSRKRQRRPRRFFDDDEEVIPNQNDVEASGHSEGEGEEAEMGDEKNKDEDDDDDEEEDDDDDDDDDEEDEDDDEVPQRSRRRYSLRTKRAQPLRLVYEIQQQTRQPSRGIFDHLPTPAVHKRRRHPAAGRGQQHPSSPYQRKQRRTNSQGASSTSSSSGDDDETKFEKRKKKSLAKARNRCLPMNLTMNELASHGFANERRKIGSSLADIDPMNVDKSVKFESIGGHKSHVRSLKEMVVFPLLYPEVFQKFHINPPRGCLFYGPPGTGKTLMARALANECSSESRKVAFFMRKGADCLSKWVGESERQLRLLFDQAYQMRPAIIFFDEIDGLAPVRSSRQDQIHSSIVSTLLGLMDGLDNRGEIIVIGATNRIDSIDPALRRPGRFDREFAFPLPDKNARREILRIHTSKWLPPLSNNFVDQLAEKTVGYCGADIMTLCAESALVALRRRYPQIYGTSEKLKLDVDSINVKVADFYKAMQNIVPTAQRSDASPGQALHQSVRPLLHNALVQSVMKLAKLFPVVLKTSKVMKSRSNESTDHNQSTNTNPSADATTQEQSDSDSDFDDDDDENGEQHILLPPNGLSVPQSLLSGMSNFAYRESTVHRPRFLLCGGPQDGQTTHLAPALLHDLEGIPVHLLDLPALYGTSTRSPEEACALVFREARRTSPSIIYLPNATMWWESASATIHYIFESLLRTLPAHTSVLLIATTDCVYKEIPLSLSKFFNKRLKEVYTMRTPTVEERTAFFAPIFLQFAVKPPVYKLKKKMRSMEILEKAPSEPPPKLSGKELARLEQEEETTMRNLRLFLRDVLTRLARDRRFKVFLKPVDTEEVTDYMDVIDHPMDISSMMNKIDQHKYNNVASFLMDINLICSNALEYNPDHCAEDKAIRHRACLLKDIAQAIVQEDLDPGFERLCNEVNEARRKRNADPLKFAPSYFNVLPPNGPACKPENSEQINGERKVSDSLAKVPHNHYRRKRRRSAWASGVVRRYKKKSRIEDDRSDEDQNEQTELDEVDDADPNKSGESHSFNGVVESDEAPHDDVFNRVGPSGDAPSPPKTENIEEDAQTWPESMTNGETKTPADLATETMDVEMEQGMSQLSSPETSQADDAEEASNEVEGAKGPQSGSCDSSSDSSDSDEMCTQAENKQEEIETAEMKPEDNPNTEDPEAEPSKEDSSSGSGMTLRPRKKSVGLEKESVPVIVIPPPPPLAVDEQKLKDIFQFTVQATSLLKVEQLERLYSNLARRIHRHRHSYDKTQMTQEIYAEVKTFLKRVLHVGRSKP
ncbi:ATPase family AAA domain-containing protein 2-like isoform X1 [Clavelina lepadiformis]|uniref:ATPase family AAA domain-containing protein 2-like isoform X1 n=1 Tax=Clavelina lepadiformis TaxID=159417 RepID=UPI0040424CDE